MGFGWRPYVSVGQRRAQAASKMATLKRSGKDIQPVEIQGRKIAHTFWGESWCDHLEAFSDYENRLPRGRTYVRNGSVCHLEVARGEIKAIVSGSELYNVKITINELSQQKWLSVKQSCTGQIGSLLELLQGKFSDKVMTVVTDRQTGLFPLPSEIKLDCSCPDWATMCKHVAAVLYGVGARLDQRPDLLFVLRGVDHEELIEVDAVTLSVSTESKSGKRRIAEGDLGDIFGIDMVASTSPAKKVSKVQAAAAAAVKAKPVTKAKPVPKTGAIEQTSYTSKTVRALRKSLDLSASEFAELIGVSTTTVANWESKRGRLNLQPKSLDALNLAAKCSANQSRQPCTV